MCENRKKIKPKSRIREPRVERPRELEVLVGDDGIDRRRLAALGIGEPGADLEEKHRWTCWQRQKTFGKFVKGFFPGSVSLHMRHVNVFLFLFFGGS